MYSELFYVKLGIRIARDNGKELEFVMLQVTQTRID